MESLCGYELLHKRNEKEEKAGARAKIKCAKTSRLRPAQNLLKLQVELLSKYRHRNPFIPSRVFAVHCTETKRDL